MHNFAGQNIQQEEARGGGRHVENIKVKKRMKMMNNEDQTWGVRKPARATPGLSASKKQEQKHEVLGRTNRLLSLI
jgi:hypothetical protein